MARRSRPWYRYDRRRPDKCGWWVHVGGRLHLLHRGGKSAADRKTAEQAFHELMAVAAQPPDAPDATVASLCEAFLAWSKRHQSAETFRGYRFYLEKFAEGCGFRVAGELKPYHVTRWLDANERWGPTTRYNALRSALRVFNWAKEEGLIAENPLQGMKRPRPRQRTRYMSDAEFTAITEAACPAFRSFLVALDQTGARPSELRAARWSDWHCDRLVLDQHKTRHKTGKSRVIYLNAAMQEMLASLRPGAASEHVFTNTRGTAWTLNATRLQLQRLKKKLSLADDLCLYLIRHRFGTRAAMRDLGVSTIAELMGNSAEVCGRIYVHLAGEARHLRDAVERATTTTAAAPGMSATHDPAAPG